MRRASATFLTLCLASCASTATQSSFDGHVGFELPRAWTNEPLDFGGVKATALSSQERGVIIIPLGKRPPPPLESVRGLVVASSPSLAHPDAVLWGEASRRICMENQPGISISEPLDEARPGNEIRFEFFTTTCSGASFLISAHARAGDSDAWREIDSLLASFAFR